MQRVVAVVLAAACVFVACGDGDDGDDGDATPGQTAQVTQPASTPTTAADGIRAADVQNSEPVQDLVEVTGGVFVRDNVIYGDLTEDDEEEAVVSLTSGGTLGDVGFLVLTLNDGAIEPLLTVTPESGGGIAVSIVGGQLVSVEPVPGPDDPECCPSSIRTVTYAWDGTALVVESSETVPNPDAAGAKTPEGE